MHVNFDPTSVDWSFSAASGGDDAIVQYGGYNVFRGVPYQRGAGVGSVFRSLLRYLMPIGRAVGKEGLEAGSRVLSNLVQGRDLKETLVSEGQAGVKNLLEKAANKIDEQKGRGFDFKRYRCGTFGKPPRKRKHIHKLKSSIGPPAFLLPKKLGGRSKTKKQTKRLRVDSLGTY